MRRMVPENQKEDVFVLKEVALPLGSARCHLDHHLQPVRYIASSDARDGLKSSTEVCRDKDLFFSFRISS
jgi:hypothetical protein